jgi:hypothetical protein
MMAVFDKENYELEKLKITELTNTKKYYASVDVNVNKVKIYTVAPLVAAPLAAVAPLAAAPLAGAAPLSLFEIVDENTKYELGIGPTPDNAVPFYVIMEHLDGCDYYKVSDNLYILPSLTPDMIDAKVAENKVANELLAKTEADRVEAERVAEQERLAKIEADRVEAERVAEQERLAKIEADRVEAERVAEQERLAKIEADRVEAERVAEQERLAKIEADRVEAERVAEQERLAKIEADRVEAERVADQERLAKIEADRVEAERVAEQERLAKIEADRVEAERVAEQERLAKIEADRVEAERVAEQERLAKIEADRVEAERVAEQERLANIETARVEAERVKKIEDDRIKVETDRINNCNSNLKYGNIFIQDKPIDYDCFTYFKNVKKITLINVTNIKDIFIHIEKLSSIEEIEIISNDPGKVFTFATDFDKTITEENISMLLSNLKNLEIIKFEYMIGIKTAETFLSVLMKLNKKYLKSVSICPSEEYFKNMRKTFKNTTQKNDRFVRDMITDKIEEKLIKIQNAIDLLLQFNQTSNRSINKKKIEDDRIEAERLKKIEDDRIEAERLKKIEDDRVEAERLKKIEDDRIEAERLKKIEDDRIEAERLKKIEADRIETERLKKIEDDRIEAERLKTANPLPPEPPSKEEEETARITTLLTDYKRNIKTTGYRKGLRNSEIAITGVSQTNACYINAMLQMLIDIDEFLEYILFMNGTKKQQELAKLITDAKTLAETFSNIVGVTPNLSDFLIFVYNVLRTNNQPECKNDNCTSSIIDLMKPKDLNVDSQILMVRNIIQMFGFPTSPDSANQSKRQLTREFTNNSNSRIILIDKVGVLDYNKYIEFGKLFGVSKYDQNDLNTLTLNENDLPSPIKCLDDLNEKLVKIKEFEKKHQIITALKYIFEFVINGIKITDEKDPVISKVIVQVNNVQALINVPKDKQEDASAVYGLLNGKFDDKLIQKYGLNYNENFVSPVNLEVNGNRPLSEAIKNNVSMKEENKDNQKYIIFGNPQSSNVFDKITIEGKTFNPIGIVQHLGASSAEGARGGHYIYYSFKSNKLLNDKTVSETTFNPIIIYTKCVVLYERVETTPGGGKKQKLGSSNRGTSSSGTSNRGKTPVKFRVSRRKIKKTSSI